MPSGFILEEKYLFPHCFELNFFPKTSAPHMSLDTNKLPIVSDSKSKVAFSFDCMARFHNNLPFGFIFAKKTLCPLPFIVTFLTFTESEI